MTLRSSNKVETNRYELVIEIDGATFMNEVNAVYRKQVKNIAIPGFRKGKAPRAVIEREYGEGIFYEDAIKNLYPAAVAEAAKEAGLAMVQDKVDLDIEEANKDILVIKSVITVEPETAIENYKGIEYTKASTDVTDEDIDAEVKKVLERNSRLVDVEGRAAENGDIAVIDFEGFVDGVAFDGGKAEKYNLTLGDGQFIPGFEDQIIGHNIGEDFSIQVKFPDEYQAEELKGKDAEFKIKLHELKKRELPDFDDEFVKDVSEFESVDAYKADVRTKLEKKKADDAENSRDKQLTDKLAELLQAEIPEAMFTNQINNMLGEFEMNLRAQGLDFDTYMQYTGMNINDLAENYRPVAERQVKVSLALKKIAELENIAVSDEDVANKYQELADTYKVELDRVKNVFSAEDIVSDIKVLRALDLVRENAVAVEAAAE
ncbi:MAG: trigger factor [Acutalibacteraceae bacterium]